MKINEIIRAQRKKQNLTQEYIANYLNVTASAVNKWENAISYPDITVLAPLARILKIDVNTLLSFNEELTDTEINKNIKELSNLVQETDYDKGFNMGCELVKKYPGSYKLIFFVANTLHAYLSLYNIQTTQEYEKTIISWYEEVIKSKDDTFSVQAAAALCGIYSSKENYSKAQDYLNQIPPLGYDKRPMQANLFMRQNNIEAAYEIYENILYKSVSEAYNSITLIISALCRENKLNEAMEYSEIAKKLSELFKYGTYMALSPKLLIDLINRDADSCINTLKQMINGLDEFSSSLKSSGIFSHIKFNKSENNMLRYMLKKSLEADPETDFLKEHEEYNTIINMLDTNEKQL